MIIRVNTQEEDFTMIDCIKLIGGADKILD